ncbi:hypothetical protein SS1G_10856 [Sclerotinia sclerotiorum 1980 UF-70]|uniref:Major facilitator superfamily (MFS) profile domain-containing protein n=1 Tax=Sclerotinia sclerotiorum (strain ATCC 18683 / 1980 / Ss-1) TaxID=665079 RepID=A7EZT9_SCLS1|nr:hypothetical protein SS1G_10856 [Sclerotinia sclerotiorum 1980 UF-70]EDN94981.1 hypothetical protein SS1G_10856 [Sclerotinia sclerotiorum 1980 UF-70]
MSVLAEGGETLRTDYHTILMVQKGGVNSTGFKDTFGNPDPTITGLIVAIYEIGCFLGSVATSVFGENIGRKKSIAIGVMSVCNFRR